MATSIWEGQSMSKFLLTVCAFGLLLSSAFAQEKRSHIFGIDGLQTETFSRFVAAGAKQRMGFYAALHLDCSATGDVNVRITKQPEHGTVETTTSTDYTYFPKENIRSKSLSENI